MHMQTMYCYEHDAKNKNNVLCGLGGINHGIVVPQRLQITPGTWLCKLKRSHKCIVKSSIEKITVIL